MFHPSVRSSIAGLSTLRAFAARRLATVRVALLTPALALLSIAATTPLGAQSFYYWNLDGLTAGSGPGAAPSGTWSIAQASWSAAADGAAIPFPWFNNNIAVFSAGSDATGAYTVTLDTSAGAISAAALIFDDGDVTLGGTGTLVMFHPLTPIPPYLSVLKPTTIGPGITLAGIQGLTIGGGGTLFLQGQTTVLGRTLITGADVVLGADERLSDLSTVQLESSTTLDLAGFDETLGGLAGSGKITLGAGTLTIAGADNTIFSGGITGTGGVIKAGTGSLSLTTPAAWTGGTTISGGNLISGASHLFADDANLTVLSAGTWSLDLFSERVGAITGTGQVVLAGGTLELGDASSFTFGGTFAGLGTITKRGSGLLTLTGANTFIGTTSVTGGTLRLGASDRLADVSALDVGAGATFDLQGHNEGLDALTGTGTVELGTGNLTVGLGHSIFTFGGTVTGSGNLNKSGSGFMTLAGTFASTGDLLIPSGVLILGASHRIADTADVFIGPGAGLVLAGFDETIATLSGFGSVDLGAGHLTLAGAGDSAFAGTMTGSGRLTKRGAGTFTLLGTATHTGLTTIAEGRLRLGSDSRLASTADVQLDGGTVLELGGFAQILDALTGTGEVKLGTDFLAPGTLGLGWSGSSFSFGGRVTGIGSVQKHGAGTLTLTAPDAIVTDLTLLAGRVALGVDDALLDTWDVVVSPGTTLDLAGKRGRMSTLVGAGTVDLGVGGALTLAPTADRAFAGTITGFGSLTIDGARWVTLSGPLTFSGPTSLINGGLAIASSGVIDTDVATTPQAIFKVEDYEVGIDQLTGTGPVQLLGRLTIGSSGGDFTYGGALTGEAGSRLAKSGAGAFTLAGTSSAAEHLVAAGSLHLAADERLADTSAVQVVTGATFLVDGHTETIGALTGGGTVMLGSPDTGPGRLAVGAGGASFSFAGDISGLGDLEKRGAGTFTLAGEFLASGGLTITGGVLKLGAAERLADAAPVHLADGAGFDLDGHDETIATLTGPGAVKLDTGATLTLAGGGTDFTLAAVLEGHGHLTKLGDGTVTFTGKAAELQSLFLGGGTFVLTSDLRLGQVTLLTLAAGATLDLGNHEQRFLGLAGSGDVATGVEGHLIVDGGDFAGAFTGAGVVTKRDAGTFAFAPAAPFAGLVAVEAGELILHGVTRAELAHVDVTPPATLTLEAGLTLAGELTSRGLVRVAPPTGKGGGDPSAPVTLEGAVSGTGGYEGRFVFAGSFAPGASAALVTVTGDLVFAPGHTLHVELGGLARGTGYDALDVTGELALGGTLHVSLLGGFVPAAGDSFQLFEAGERVGAFAAFELPVLPTGSAWDTSALATTGWLQVVPTDGLASYVALAGLDPATDGAPGANPSGDGVANLLKFLFGADPRLNQPWLAPATVIESTGEGGRVLVFSYTRSAGASAALALEVVETSTNLATWTPVVHGLDGAVIEVTTQDETTESDLELVTVRVPVAGERLFARLRVALP